LLLKHLEKYLVYTQATFIDPRDTCYENETVNHVREVMENKSDGKCVTIQIAHNLFTKP